MRANLLSVLGSSQRVSNSRLVCVRFLLLLCFRSFFYLLCKIQLLCKHHFSSLCLSRSCSCSLFLSLFVRVRCVFFLFLLFHVIIVVLKICHPFSCDHLHTYTHAYTQQNAYTSVLSLTLTNTYVYIQCVHAEKKVPWLLIAVEMCMRFFPSIIRFALFFSLSLLCSLALRANQIFFGSVSLVDISYKFYTEYCLGSLQVIYLSFGSSSLSLSSSSTFSLSHFF